MIRACVLIILTSLSFALYGQHLPANYAPFAIYKDAQELFQKEKYGAAQEKFRQFQETEARGSVPNETLVADAEYFHALCAYHLLREDAAELLTAFTVKRPDHAKTATARFYLARMYYIKKNYKKAAEHLAALNLEGADEAVYGEGKFMLGYSYYMLGDGDKTVETLGALGEKLGPYHDQANYYCGVTEFNRGKYGEALKSFKQIDGAAEYRAKTPVYIANCLLNLKEYKALELFGEEIAAANYPIDQKANIQRQIAFALYELEKYDKAMPYFEAYVEATPKADAKIYYRMGYACYKMKEYDPAIFYFKKIVENKDTTAQVGAYYLACSYAALNKMEEARNGFKRAYGLKYSVDISREALLQYAVLSFENKYFEDAHNSLKKYVHDYPNDGNISLAKGLIGEVLFYSNQFSEAIRYFEEAGLKDKRSQLAYQKSCYYYGVKLYEESKKDSAIHFLNKAANGKADKRIALEATFWTAEIAFNEKNYKQALIAYQKFTEAPESAQDEYYPHALMGIAWCHFKQKNLPAAASKFKEVAGLPGLKEKNADLYVEANLRSGDCFFAKKEYQKAIAQYQKITEFGQGQADYALYQTGLCHERLTKREDAIFLLKKLVATYKQSAYRDKSLYELASIYLKWYSDYVKAAQYSKQLIDEHPNSELIPNAYNTVAIAAMNSDDKPTAVENFKTVLFNYGSTYEQAQIAMDEISGLLPPSDFNEVLQKYKQKYPNTNVKLENLAFANGRDLYLLESKFPEAIENLTQYIKDFPDGKYFHEAFLLRGECYQNIEKIDDAIKDFEKAATARNNSEVVIKAYNNIAEVYMDKRDFAKAIAVYTKAIPLSNDVEITVPLQLGLGKAYMVQNHYPQAAKIYETIMRNVNASQYSRTHATLHLAYALRGMEKGDSALALFKTVAVKNTDEIGAEAQYMTARMCFEQGKFDESKAAVMRLKERFPTFNKWKAKAFIVMAENYAAQGERFQAIETLKSIIEKSTDKEIIKEAEKRLKEIEKDEADAEANKSESDAKPAPKVGNPDPAVDKFDDMMEDVATTEDTPRGGSEAFPETVVKPKEKELAVKKERETAVEKPVAEKKAPVEKKATLTTPDKKPDSPKKEEKTVEKPEKKAVTDKKEEKPIAKGDKKPVETAKAKATDEPKVFKRTAAVAQNEPDVHRGLTLPPKTDPEKKDFEKKSVEKPVPPKPKPEELKSKLKAEEAKPKPTKTEEAKPKTEEKAPAVKPASAEKTPEKKAAVKPLPEKKTENVAPKTRPTNENLPPSATEKKIVAAASDNKDVYHLIAEGVTGKPAADKSRAGWAEKGFKVALLEGKATGSYRISIYQSKNQEEVQKKKKELLGFGVVNSGAWVFKQEK